MQFFETVGSTNDAAIEHARAGDLVFPTLFLTAQQISGRGRLGREWTSSAGNLALSYSFNASGRLQNASQILPLLAMAAGLSVTEMIRVFCPGLDVAIKWPNDVFIGSRKCSGILIETVPCKQSVAVVVGIGINVNQPIDRSTLNATGRLAEPTSLYDEIGTRLDLTELVIALVQRLRGTIQQIGHQDSNLVQDYNRSLWGRNERLTLRVGSDEYTGICKRVNDHGELVLGIDSREFTFASGTVISIGSSTRYER